MSICAYFLTKILCGLDIKLRHQINNFFLSVSSFALLLVGNNNVSAQTSSPGAPIILDKVTVSSETPADAIRKRFDSMSGGVSVIDYHEMPLSSNLTMARALSQTPGVVVQNFFGSNDQPRIQIRGSGLQQNPVERGILIMQDGLPLNSADGSYITGLANPKNAELMEVYRGYMSNRIGATVLGGAINSVSPTGLSQPGATLWGSGGSFGQYNYGGQVGFAKQNVDAFITFDHIGRDGFRDYNSSDRTGVSGNIGFKINDVVTTRFFAGYTDLGFDVSGPISKDMIKKHPKMSWSGPTITPDGVINLGPNVWRDRPRREATQFRVGNRTTVELDAHTFDLALGYTRTDDMVRFPIPSGVRNTQGGDFTGLFRYAYSPDAAKPLPLVEISAQYSKGSMDRDYYVNQSGRKGEKFGDNELDSSTFSFSASMNIPLLEKLTLSPSLSYAHANRDNDDKWHAPTRPTIAYNPRMPNKLLPNGAVPTDDTSYNRSYSGWSPALGLSYKLTNTQTIYAAVSRSFEPPTHDDLLSTVNGTPNTSAGRPNPAMPRLVAKTFATPDLDEQTATTVEGGWRGIFDRYSWDISSYYSWVDNELLSLRDVTGAPLGAVNADKTHHFGIETAFGLKITDRLTTRIAYTYQEFRFDDDPIRHNNYLAGAPRHIVNTVVQYQPIDSWVWQSNIHWIPKRTPVDNMNTLYSDSYVVVDLRSEYQLNKTVKIFGEITNIFNEKYASSTIIANQAQPNQAAFLPGEGRGFFAGIKAIF